jgi:uncharacterized membrane protein (DUF373 family)
MKEQVAMPNHETDFSKSLDLQHESLATTRKTDPAHHSPEPADRIAIVSGHLLDRANSVIYAIVGVCFLLSGLFALGYSFWQFSMLMGGTLDPAHVVEGIITLISDLLLVLIIMEVLGTVIHYLKLHTTSLRPFLFIGIISATRGILSISARLAVGHVPDFTGAMIELGVNAAVILALGITLKLLEKINT